MRDIVRRDTTFPAVGLSGFVDTDIIPAPKVYCALEGMGQSHIPNPAEIAWLLFKRHPAQPHSM
ncbi:MULTISPECIES: hypothetical protein [Chroococcidiopsis]|uniref:hypothetical protein n=1 Tax=Chroococcidiopsis TaxID=54298 RepID=UPI00030499B9|nr:MULTISPECIES: hypothetical protein [Chroococcidiopsis]